LGPMAASARFERTYRVRFDEAGPGGALRSSGYLRYAQDLAGIHSQISGFDRDWYAGRGLTFLVRAVELDIVGDVQYGTELVTSTEVVGFRRVWARRRSEFRAPGSERPLAIAITDWVLLNARGAPSRVPAEIVDAFVDHEANFTPLRLDLPPTPANATAYAITVRRSEIDPMAHVNNAAYLDYLDEQLLVGSPADATLPLPRRYRAEFIASAEPGAQLAGQLWQAAPGSLYRLEDDDGREMLRARVETDLASWVGG
ncbi:MAG: acyl-ACP thioesterase domain-containing protein, partial [Candidatus Limnocylindrales bacterium]